jgi:hypothetical protein|tara:strand:+ start:3258 stop:3548 length:291 start_codon:yes stop_codon:yes gene_type:complete
MAIGDGLENCSFEIRNDKALTEYYLTVQSVYQPKFRDYFVENNGATIEEVREYYKQKYFDLFSLVKDKPFEQIVTGVTAIMNLNFDLEQFEYTKIN